VIGSGTGNAPLLCKKYFALYNINFHDGRDSYCSIQVYDTVVCGVWVPVFQWNMLPPFQGRYQIK
jgi:hypothetical protein